MLLQSIRRRIGCNDRVICDLGDSRVSGYRCLEYQLQLDLCLVAKARLKSALYTPVIHVAGFSFNRHRFRQIPGLIDVTAAADGDVIREQLQRNDRENRREQIARWRNLDHVIGDD